MKTSSKQKKIGLGMDLSWQSQEGFIWEDESFKPSPTLKKFLIGNEKQFDHFFFSLQPMSFDLLDSPQILSEYFKAYDSLLETIPHLRDSLSLHHTFLNLATDEDDYPREKIVEFTNKIIKRYNIKWVNEDLGLWMIKGKTLPYPLPPVLNEYCQKKCMENIAFYQKNLDAKLYVEFPGFSEGHSFTLGHMDGFEFYQDIIKQTQADAVFDTGHILSYQWLRGNGQDYLKNLDTLLPFDHCKEIHLSGCSIVGDEFFDFHHGIIRNEQLELLNYLLPKCKNLEIVTYEDPKFTGEGNLIPKSLPNYFNLIKTLKKWKKNEILL